MKKNKRTLIVYQMYEENEITDFFLDNGVVYDKNVDYVFVINVSDFERDPIGFKPSEKFNNAIESVSAKVFYRDNTGKDFGGYSCVVDRFSKSGLIDLYDFFIFMNQTLIGPLLPDWSKDLFHWSSVFTSLINERDRLAGLSINCWIFSGWEREGLKLPFFHLSPDGNGVFAPHVQTMLFVMDKLSLKLASDEGIFDYKNILEDKHRTIIEKEIRLSEIILLNNYNIASVLDCSRGVDFRKGVFDEAWGDIWSNEHFLSLKTDNSNKWKNEVKKMRKTHPYETIFVKANRGTEKQKAFISNLIKNKKYKQ